VAEIAISQAIKVRSYGDGVYGGLTNAAATIVQRTGSGNHRIFNISDAGAVLDGLTIRNGLFDSVNSDGAGVYMTGGTLLNCIVKDNRITGNPWDKIGGGICILGGSLTNCVIVSNTAPSGGGIAIGNVVIADVHIERCQITDNTTLIYNQIDVYNGGGILALNVNGNPAHIHSSLIARNSGYWAGAGMRLKGKVFLYNCTVVSNVLAGTQAGGSGIQGGIVIGIYNSIVYDNIGGLDGNSVVQSSGVVYMEATCYTNPTPASQGTLLIDASCITDPPQFKNLNAYDYSLSSTSPCIDIGTNTQVTVVIDLAGNDRILYGGMHGSVLAPIVDMGAYEYVIESIASTAQRNLVIPVDREVLRERNVFWP
jgi:hypothetical protein